MATSSDFRRGIENAIVHAELAPSDEIRQLWQHIRENYEYLLMFDERVDALVPPSRPLVAELR